MNGIIAVLFLFILQKKVNKISMIKGKD